MFAYVAPDDFLEQSGTVELMSTSTKQCISIPIVDDSVNEADQECFTVSLSESSGTVDLTLSPAIATVCINDTDGKIGRSYQNCIKTSLLVYFITQYSSTLHIEIAINHTSESLGKPVHLGH